MNVSSSPELTRRASVSTRSSSVEHNPIAGEGPIVPVSSASEPIVPVSSASEPIVPVSSASEPIIPVTPTSGPVTCTPSALPVTPIPGESTTPVDTSPSVTLSAALLAQQLPPLSKFSGEFGQPGVEVETFQEWLEQFELVAAVGHWDQSAKLANLVTRLKGQAFAFFRSCPAEQRTDYALLVAELKRRFTPIHLSAVQTSMFHDRKQGEKETVDSYAQDLRRLFHRAYPSSQREGQEAETIAQNVLTNQFVAGLLPAIKVKVAGSEGRFEELLTKARFEEAKRRELSGGQRKSFSMDPRSSTSHQTAGQSATMRHHGKPPQAKEGQTSGPVSRPGGAQCYTCGSSAHFARQCPQRHRNGPAEAPGRERGQTRKGQVATIAGQPVNSAREQAPESVEDLRQRLHDAEVREALNDVTATMHGIQSGQSSRGTNLGPIPTATVVVEGEEVLALLDTGSPVTILSLEYLLQLLARKRSSDTTPAQWRAMVEKRLQPTNLKLHNYGGGQLPVVRQTTVALLRGCYSVSATVQVQKGAPTPLLVGTDILSCLGFTLQQKDGDGTCVDLLQGQLQQEEQEKQAASLPEPGRELTVCALQAVRLPGRHGRLLPAQVDGSVGPRTLLFVPEGQLVREENLQIAEAVVEPDSDGMLIVLLENHSCKPIVLEKGVVLGTLQEVEMPSNELAVDKDEERQLQDLGGESPTVAKVDGTETLTDQRAQQVRESVIVDEANLTPGQQRAIDELVEEYQDVFALDPRELGSTDLAMHVIDTGDSKPIKQAPRRMPFVLHQKVEEMTKQMLDAGVIRPSKSPWASPVVLVRKKDGSHRFCVDYRRLNAKTKMDVFPLPHIDDTLDLLSQTKFFTTLDLASGYWQVQMDSNSQEKTAFVTHSGLYEFCVMPFGLCNAPSTFQRLMEAVLSGLARECCMVYIDDILVTGREFEDHLSNLRKVLERLRSAGLKLKPQKCFFGSGQVEYLGYVVSRDGISADPKKVTAVRDFPPPHDVRALQSFLGLASYYRRFIQGFSVVANPLFALLRKDVEYHWTSVCQEAFDRLKQLLTEAPVLAFPSFDRGFILDTDASGIGLGAVLAQKQDDGSIRPVAFASRSLQLHEKNYGVTELEALGVVWAVKHFRHYLYGQSCDVYTDHEALKSLLNTPHPSGKLARWGMALQEVDLTIHYRPGRKNANADSLSRNPEEDQGTDPLERDELRMVLYDRRSARFLPRRQRKRQRFQ